jgi:hypothetical protein
LPQLPLAAGEAIFCVLVSNAGPRHDQVGWSTLLLQEDRAFFTWFMKDAGYPAETVPMPFVRAGNRLTCTGALDLDLERKTDPLSHVERTASLNLLMQGRSDHLAKPTGEVEVVSDFPRLLDGYGVRIQRANLGGLGKLGVPGLQPREAWWWESPHFGVEPRKVHPWAS